MALVRWGGCCRCYSEGDEDNGVRDGAVGDGEGGLGGAGDDKGSSSDERVVVNLGDGPGVTLVTDKSSAVDAEGEGSSSEYEKDGGDNGDTTESCDYTDSDDDGDNDDVSDGCGTEKVWK